VSTLVILGAGDLGGALARQLAAADVVSTIVLVDEAGAAAEGKALDIRQASPVDRYSTSLRGSSQLDAAIGTDFVVLADRFSASDGEWHGDSAVALVSRVSALNKRAPILCAGAKQADVVGRAVRELGLPRSQVFGSAAEGLRSAIIALTALEASCAATDIELSVIGRAPDHIIVPWEEASIGGRRATEVLSPPSIARLEARLTRLWPPGPLTLASAATRVIRAALSRTPRTVSAFVSVAREQGALGAVGMLPVTVSPHGVEKVVVPALCRRDQVRLETALTGN